MSVRMLLEEISIWISRLSREDHPSNVYGHYPAMEGLNRTKRQRKGNLLSLTKLKHLLSSALPHLHSWFSDIWTWTWTYTISFSGSQAYRLWLNYTTGFPGSPVYRQQIVGLFGLHITRANSYNKYSYICSLSLDNSNKIQTGPVNCPRSHCS